MAIHKVNGVLVRVATYSNGSHMKHGGFHVEHMEPVRVALDEAASIKVAPSIPGNSYHRIPRERVEALRASGIPAVGNVKRFAKPVRFSRLTRVSK